LATGVCATVLCWVLGSELVVDPWQPNVLVLPCFALLAATAAVVSGGWRWLPATAALASLCVQTHLGYLLLGSALLATAVASLVWRSTVEGRGWPWRIIAATALIVAVMWSPVLWQQFFGPGRGNLGAVLTAATGEGDRVGLAVALRLWSAVTMIPPAWFRPSYRDPPQALLRLEEDAAGLDLGALPSMWVTLLTVLIAVGIAGLVVNSARRYRVDGSRAGMLVAVIGTLAAVVTLALLRVDLFGVVAHKYRYFWALAAYATSVVAGHVIALVGVTLGRRAVRSTIVGLAAAAALFTVLAIPTQPLDQGGVSNRGLWPSLRELRSQLASYRPSRVVEVETSGLPFPDHYTHAVLAQLSENGLKFQVTTDTMVGQLGRSRAADDSASHRLIVRQAPNDDEPVPGGRLISRVQLENAPSVAVFELTE
jgi:hypothetical protein